jgi:hypothetical protein
MIVTTVMIATYLEESGWKLEARGAWRNPRTRLGGYSMLAALQNQILYDEVVEKKKAAGGT